MRRMIMTVSAVFALAVLAMPADAQLKVGAQAAMMTSLDEATELDGVFGLGGRLALDPPLFPLGAIVSATYYFPDTDPVDLTYWTATAAAQLRLPLTVVKPYVLAGWQLRRASVGDISENENGPVIGAGVQVDLALSLFLEATFEFNEEVEANPDLDNNPLVIKGGVMFGG